MAAQHKRLLKVVRGVGGCECNIAQNTFEASIEQGKQYTVNAKR
jgi:hypothetical protein